jgi:hypothetical protein
VRIRVLREKGYEWARFWLPGFEGGAVLAAFEQGFARGHRETSFALFRGVAPEALFLQNAQRLRGRVRLAEKKAAEDSKGDPHHAINSGIGLP